MVKKIIACSDIHIRNMKRMDETSEMLQQFINECKEIVSKYNEGEVRIVCAGDLFHQKIDVSNESNVITSWFLRELGKVAKTFIIAGNHDLLMNNKSRLDSITPLFTIGNFQNCIYLDRELGYESGIYEDDNIVWCLYSSFSDLSKPNFGEHQAKNPNKIYVGLIHGDVNGATTDTGRITENNLSTSEFKDLDFVIAGHIHKYQEIKKHGTPIVYCSSLIQQDYGENVNGHGYVLWDVENISHELIELKNKNYGFFKFKISDLSDLENNKETLINN